jgi:hypothetical protein
LKTLRDVVKLEVADHETVGPQYGVAKLFLRNQVAGYGTRKGGVSNLWLLAISKFFLLDHDTTIIYL